MTEPTAVRLDDPHVVAKEYVSENRLVRRAAAVAAAVPGQPDLVAAVVDELRRARARRVLEVGCGWGWLAERIDAETEAEVVAVDLAPRMVELARDRGVDARLGDVQALSFSDAEFDAAVAAWMLYHVPDLDRGISELARVLRPGGLLLAITNSARHLQELRDLVRSGPSPAKFTRENGAEALSRHFSRVRRVDVDGSVDFATRADVVDYVEASIAMSPFAAGVPTEVPEPFVATRATSLFIAETTG